MARIRLRILLTFSNMFKSFYVHRKWRYITTLNDVTGFGVISNIIKVFPTCPVPYKHGKNIPRYASN